MNPEAHGGDRIRMASLAGRAPANLLDFSVNVRPEGPPDFLRAALVRAMFDLAAYPSPYAAEAVQAAACYHDRDEACFVFGNGSNELIHALARTLNKRGTPATYLIEPSFSEYRIACHLAGLDTLHVWGGLNEAKDAALLQSLADAPAGSAVFLANPGNPSGFWRTPEACLSLLASRPDLLWIIDEAFIEYAGPDETASVLRRLPENGVVLRSLTKFYAVPGVRLGYLTAKADLAAAIRREIPAWSVNAFALSAACAVFADSSDFAKHTRSENIQRRADLVNVLSALSGVSIIPSAANYVLLRCSTAPRDLLTRLLKNFGIAVRDCSNYHGLEDGTWFRAAVRLPDEHRRLANALAQILPSPNHSHLSAVPPFTRVLV